MVASEEEVKHAITVVGHRGALLLATVLFGQTCLAQGDSWENLKSIQSNTRVSVKLHSGKAVNGRMQAWSTEELTVLEDDGSAYLARSNVARVWLVTGRTRGQKAKRAFLVTSAVLIGAAAIVYSVRYRGVEDGGVVLVAGLYAAPVVGAIAAAIASLFPPHKELIYAAPARPRQTP
jgi:hypothetical protein